LNKIAHPCAYFFSYQCGAPVGTFGNRTQRFSMILSLKAILVSSSFQADVLQKGYPNTILYAFLVSSILAIVASYISVFQ